MVATKDLKHKFISLEEFERFRIHWIRICAKLNKKSRNKEILPEAEKRAVQMLADGTRNNSRFCGSRKKRKTIKKGK